MKLSDKDRYMYILNLSDDNIKATLLKYLSFDVDKESIINTFIDEKLKLEGIKQLCNESKKVNIINSFKNGDLVEQSLSFVNNASKVKIINGLYSESDRLRLSLYIENENFRFDVYKLFNDDKIMYLSLSNLVSDCYKIRIISKIQDKKIFYEAIKKLNNEQTMAFFIARYADEDYRPQCLSLINDEMLKSYVIASLTDDNVKANLLSLLNIDAARLDVINSIQDENIKIELLSVLTEEESKVLVISQIKNNQTKNQLLQTINNYDLAIRNVFNKGLFENLYCFDVDILRKIFDTKQMRVIEEYGKIKNKEMRLAYSEYVSSNYDNISIESLDKVSSILFSIETSNSKVIQEFGDLIVNQILKHSDPIYCFSQIENVFIKNELPYVCKMFKVFKLLYNDVNSYVNFSPVLDSFASFVNGQNMIDSIIFGDLLKCALGSNNRSLKLFVENLDKGNTLLDDILKQDDSLDYLNELEKNILTDYLDKIELILDCYEKYQNKKGSLIQKYRLSLRLDCILDTLNLKRYEYNKVLDVLTNKICGIFGINTFYELKKYFQDVIRNADERNRRNSRKPLILVEGDFVKGIGDINYLSKILQNGSVSKAFLGCASDLDSTPLDTDLSRILSKDVEGKSSSELGKIIASTISNMFGDIWLVLKNDSDSLEITKDLNGINRNSIAFEDFSKIETFQTLECDHYGIRTGFPSGVISYIIAKSNFDIIGLEIALNGFYIPVVDMNGNLMFSPEDYDLLRNKMSGLSYYGEYKYNFSDNLINKDVLTIVEKLENNIAETKRRKNLIYSKIKELLLEFGLKFKDTNDGDLSMGSVEFIDTGSTGRFTNCLGEGDFDFIVRVDKNFLLNDLKMDQFRKRFLEKLGKDNSTDLTFDGDFRLTEVKLDDKTVLDIDITFVGKSDSIVYSTDMCFQDRLHNIYNQDKEKYNLVIANIILAKQVLKKGNVYKSQYAKIPQGGLGGSGIECWILQNGGSFIDAAKSFLDAAEGRTFEEFCKIYPIWRLGEGYMRDRKGEYLHENFVYSNMNEMGYSKMTKILKDYIIKCQKNNFA